ncbi:MAG TPA: putative 2OG-Fe(II) oxygenase [Steroidobacteraceae bacterium]
MTSPLLVKAMRRVGAVLQAGGYQAAHEQLETIVAANPGYVEALRLLAGTKQALGDAAAAEGLLRQALALEPGWPPAMAMLGEILLNSGRVLEAEPFLQRAATALPANARAALVLARHYNDTLRPALALALLGPLCAAGKADADLVALHIAVLAALGRRDEAVALYGRMAAASPGDPGAAQALAMALEGADQHEEAARVARQTLRQGHRTAALYHTYARSLRAVGAPERAEAALRDCLALEPRLVEAQSNLAELIWLRTGDITQATAVLDQALQRFATEDALWAAKAAILQAAGDARAAYACLAEQATRPRAPTNLLVRAGLAALEFDSAAALALAERAVGTMPTSAPARTLLVAAQLGVGDARAAIPHCESLLAHAPDDQYLIALQTTAWRLLQDERYAQLCDYRHLVVSEPLEAPEPWPDLASFLFDLTVSLERLHDPHGHPLLFQSLRHGTETTQDLLRSADPVIQALFRSFAAPIGRYVERAGRGSDPLRRRNGGKWRFNGSWSVRLRRSGYHANHVHPRGWISSAFYIQLPDSTSDARNKEGSLSFGEPGIATNPPLHAQYAVRPEVGMLVLFPSYFWHGTVPFASDEARLTVAFDVVPDG